MASLRSGSFVALQAKIDQALSRKPGVSTQGVRIFIPMYIGREGMSEEEMLAIVKFAMSKQYRYTVSMLPMNADVLETWQELNPSFDSVYSQNIVYPETLQTTQEWSVAQTYWRQLYDATPLLQHYLDRDAQMLTQGSGYSFGEARQAIVAEILFYLCHQQPLNNIFQRPLNVVVHRAGSTTQTLDYVLSHLDKFGYSPDGLVTAVVEFEQQVYEYPLVAVSDTSVPREVLINTAMKSMERGVNTATIMGFFQKVSEDSVVAAMNVDKRVGGHKRKHSPPQISPPVSTSSSLSTSPDEPSYMQQAQQVASRQPSLPPSGSPRSSMQMLPVPDFDLAPPPSQPQPQPQPVPAQLHSSQPPSIQGSPTGSPTRQPPPMRSMFGRPDDGTQDPKKPPNNIIKKLFG